VILGCWGRAAFSRHDFYFLLALLQVFVGIVEKLEKVGGFSGGEPSCSGVILVGMILARELAVVYFDLQFRCAEAEAKDRGCTGEF